MYDASYMFDQTFKFSVRYITPLYYNDLKYIFILLMEEILYQLIW